METQTERKIETAEKKRKIYELSHLQSGLLLLIAGFGIWFLVAALAPDAKVFYVEQCLQHPSLFLLNILPIFLLLGILYALTNRSIFTVLLTSGAFGLLAVIDRYKINFRADPLIPADYTLVTELLATLRHFDIKFILLILLALIVFLVLLICSLRFFRDKKKRLWLRGVLLSSCLLLAVLSCYLYYSDTDRYSSYKVNANIYFKVNEYNCKGFVYSFLVDYFKMSIKDPAGYDEAAYMKLEMASYDDTEDGTSDNTEVDNTAALTEDAVDEAVAAEGTAAEAKVQPHIIMIMGEAFADLEYGEHISFDGYHDPLKNFKKLVNHSALGGKIMVSRFGGGTATTEFEVLTGIPSAQISNDITPYQYVRSNMNGLPRFLESEGYTTLAFHPGYSWFYNRSNVYKNLGFDNSIFLEDGFDLGRQNKGGYISEEVTMDRLIGEFDAHLKEDAHDPMFLFSVTIQNHGPYERKYGAEPCFATDLTLNDDEIDMLSNYFAGLNDADDQLGRLAAYLRTLSEPVVLVYFGDHLPGFTGGLDFYEKLQIGVSTAGKAENLVKTYSTPFFIWENDAAADADVLAHPDDSVEDPHDYLMKSHYLGATLYSLLGYQDEYPYFTAMNELRKEIPIVTNSFIMYPDGKFTATPTEEENRKIQFMDGWAYYKMFDEIVK